MNLIEAIHNNDELQVLNLLESGVSASQVNANGDTPLLLASYFSYEGIVRDLLEHNAEPNHENMWGDTALTFASHVNIVKMLIDHGANINHEDQIGETPLIALSFIGYEDTVRLLLSYRADVLRENNRGDTALHQAARNGYHSIVQLLINHGACVDHQNELGNTPLIFAAQKGYAETCRVLINNGACIQKTNRFDNTAFSLASNEVAHILKARMVLNNVVDRRCTQYKVIRRWLSCISMHSPSSNQMFYEMGQALKVIQTFKELKEEVPHINMQNYHFYIEGCIN